MASRTDLSEFESSSKRPKYDSSDPEDSNICPDTSFGQYSTSSESQFDACEGVSTDSGFNEVPHYDTESQESTQESYPASPNPLKESAPNIDVQIADRINALQMRGLSDVALWRALAAQLFAPPPRQRLQHVSKLGDVVRLIRNSRNILVLTGAGVSVSCGIPDFRSRDGIYARLAVDFPDLPDPHAMFDSSYFRLDPRPFFKFAREIYPGRFTPSPCHRFIRALENHGRLLRNYTQNIDTLERSAGISRVVECHGSFADAACTRCERTVKADYIRDDIFAQRIPVCEICNPGVKSVSAMDDIDFRELVANGVMKPNIVFFGEGLPKRFHKWIRVDRTACDLLLVIGSSLKVRPVAEIPGSLPSHVPQVLINRERLPHCTSFDVELLGDSDVIINQICHMLGESWGDVCWTESLKKADKLIVPEKLQNVMFNPPNDQQPTNSDIESELHESSERENVSFFSENCCNYENGQENEINTNSDYLKIEKLKSIPDPSYTPQFAEDSCSNNWNMEHLNQIPMPSTSTFENCETKEVTLKNDVNNSSVLNSAIGQNSKFEDNSNVLNDVDVEMESESVYDPPTEKSMTQIEEKKSLKRPASVMLSEDDETKTDGRNKKSCTSAPINEISTEREGAQMDLLPTEQNNLSLSMDADHCGSSSKIQTLRDDFESTNNESCTSPIKDSSFYDDEDDEDDNSSDESMGQSKESSYDSDSSSSTVSSDDLNCDDDSTNQSSDFSSQDDDCSLLFENFGEQERQIDDNTNSVQNTEQPETGLETEEADHRPPERHTSTESTYDSGIDEDYARYKISLSDCLPINSYYYKKPNVYIFPGAEVKLKRKYLRCFR